MAAIVASGLPAQAGLEDNKTYTINIDGTVGSAGDVWAGDTNATINLTITNTSPSQSLGSANVIFPAQFVIAGRAPVASGQVVELRDLAIPPGGHIERAYTVDVRTCTSMTAQFGVQVKQSNDFKGTGNGFFADAASDSSIAVAGPCKLAFVNVPADAELGARITSVDFTPGGAPISVQVLDAGGVDRATHSTASISLFAANSTVASPSLGGTTTAGAVAGVATFSPGPTLSPSASGYTMTAKSSGLTDSPASNPSFRIVGDADQCSTTPTDPCKAEANASNGQKVVADFGLGATDSTLIVSIGAADVPSFECEGYERSGRLVSQFEFTADDAGLRGTLLLTIPNATEPLNEYQVCWAAPYTFATLSGAQAAPLTGVFKDTLQVYFGLLPDCAKRETATPPCVSDRSSQRIGRSVTVILTVAVDGRDPWGY